jgi:hypothetical protein
MGLVSPAVLDFIMEKIGVYGNISIVRVITGFLLGCAFFQLIVLSLSNFPGVKVSFIPENR